MHRLVLSPNHAIDFGTMSALEAALDAPIRAPGSWLRSDTEIETFAEHHRLVAEYLNRART